jgi:hypothetical protein
MAVVNIYGANGRSQQDAFPPAPAFPGFYNGRNRSIFDKAKFANTYSIGSKCFLGKIPSSAVLLPSSIIYFGAFGASCTLNIGDANDDDGLATVIAVASAGSSPVLEAMTSETFCRRLWEHLGYAKDPNIMLDLYATIAGAAVSTTTAFLTWLLQYSND